MRFPPLTYALCQFFTEVRLTPAALATSLFDTPSDDHLHRLLPSILEHPRIPDVSDSTLA